MNYIEDYRELRLENTAVCLGKFDGLHIGHRKLIEYSMELKKEGYHSTVVTLSVNPGLLNNTGDKRKIYLKEEKKVILEKMGVETMLCYSLDKSNFSMEPEQFVKEMLVDRLGTKAVIVGEDFRFGKNRRGDVSLLNRLAKSYGFEVKAFEKVTYQEEAVSSSRIRECLKMGKMEEANRMLGAPYCVIGEVLHGRKLGRTLGMPTINMVPDPSKLLPPNGVYASKTWIDGKEYPGISNIGVKPTVGAEEKKLVETFIFDFSDDLYGRKLKVDLYAFERPEQKFHSIEELKCRMEKDTAFGRDFFG